MRRIRFGGWVAGGHGCGHIALCPCQRAKNSSKTGKPSQRLGYSVGGVFAHVNDPAAGLT